MASFVEPTAAAAAAAAAAVEEQVEESVEQSLSPSPSPSPVEVVNPEKKKSFLVCFDFDWTAIDTDSDRWVVEQLSTKATELVNENRNTIQWTKLMNMAVQLMHDEGITVEQIRACQASVPFRDATLESLRYAHGQGAQVIILSDANTFFINSFLEHHKMFPYIHKVITNNGQVRDGRLHITPFHPLEAPPHTCQWCPPNLCKGSVLHTLFNSGSGDASTSEWPDKIVYAGDGGGDFCPAVELRETDVLMMRFSEELPRAQGLSRRVKKHQGLVKAQVNKWDWGETLLTAVKEALV